MSSGGVKCWGFNGQGQLGNGTETNSSVPVDVTGLSSGVTAIAAGGEHTCALTPEGGVKCWGYNFYGQLGNGTKKISSVPVDVSGLSSGVKAIAAGNGHTCALTSGGGLKCWGDDYMGQLGDGKTRTESNVPVDVLGLSSGVAAIAVGTFHTCALTSGGGVKCWGPNGYGNLGIGTATSSSIPMDVIGLSSAVAAIAAGEYQTCVLLSSGQMKCWGLNNKGQLGDGTTTNRSIPVDVIGLSSGVAAIAAGSSPTCALTLSGGVKCWGWNTNGQLGNGTTLDSSVPLDVSGLSNGVVSIAAGGFHVCAVTSGGGVKCWGMNELGALGDGTTADSSVPVDVIM
jgi:alpha-tubulin suppressor-like RCC1 family protein